MLPMSGGTEGTMNNGDSFHNGETNLAFQKRNRMNLQGTAESTVAADSAASDNGTALDGTGCTTPTPPQKPMSSPEHRGYIDVYARRVAERRESDLGGENNSGENRPDEFGNTPAATPSGMSSGSAGHSGIPYYEEGGKTAMYVADPAEITRKDSLNLIAMIMGIVSFAGNLLCLTCLTPFTAILAIVFGCLGRVGGKFQGKGLAGFVLGIVYCAITLLTVLFFVTVMVAASADGVGEPL